MMAHIHTNEYSPSGTVDTDIWRQALSDLLRRTAARAPHKEALLKRKLYAGDSNI